MPVCLFYNSFNFIHYKENGYLNFALGTNSSCMFALGTNSLCLFALGTTVPCLFALVNNSPCLFALGTNFPSMFALGTNSPCLFALRLRQSLKPPYSRVYKSTITGREYKGPATYTCKTENVIYLITCTKCKKQYVG